MKLNDIVEIIYNKDGGNRTEVGKVGIIKHPFGNYNWLVDIYNFTTGKIEYGEELKEEQLRVLDNMPKESREYTANEIEEFRKIYEVKEDELRNFKEYDLDPYFLRLSSSFCLKNFALSSDHLNNDSFSWSVYFFG